MNEYFDIVSEDLFKENNISEVEEIFTFLSISTVYVVKEINSKEDFTTKIILPESKNNKIKYLSAYLLNNLDLDVSKKEGLFLGTGLDVSNISKILSSKKIKYLFNPFSSMLAFDEGSANLAKQNSKKIIINLNDYREDRLKSSKAIKQSFYIFNICMKNKIDFLFCSYAKKTEDLIDPKISINFLKSFEISETLSKRLFTEKL